LRRKQETTLNAPAMITSDQRMNPTTLERIIPDELSENEATGSETLQLHVERYQFAKEHLVRGSLLDLACGVGYGTALLSKDERISLAVGVDIDNAAIQYAKERYRGQNVIYICAEALDFQPDRQFDNIVSLETIEHVDDPQALFAHLVSLLAPRGRLIASVPVTPSVDANPHHRSNFSITKFKGMGNSFSLKYVTSLGQVQRYNPITIAVRKEARTANLRGNLVDFYLQHPSHLLLRIWSTLRDGFANKYLTVVWEK
jgi:2-polyprenyl-3-methyl-5-hydroxy-6-metoxy-1,4-benzoquinol methylase